MARPVCLPVCLRGREAGPIGPSMKLISVERLAEEMGDFEEYLGRNMDTDYHYYGHEAGAECTDREG